jgi:hypothetical protein
VFGRTGSFSLVFLHLLSMTQTNRIRKYRKHRKHPARFVALLVCAILFWLYGDDFPLRV